MLRRITACLNAIALLMVSLVPLTISSATAQAQTPTQPVASKLAPELQPSSTGGQSPSSPGGTPSNGEAGGIGQTVQVVIQATGQISQAQRDALADVNGTISESYETLNTLTARVPLAALGSLASRDDVSYISSNRAVTSQLSLTRETVGAAAVAAERGAGPGYTGKGVTIAVMDTGISTTHPDFDKNRRKSRILTAVDFTGSTQAGDLYGHGTGVASVAAGGGDASVGYATRSVGIAPDANLVDLRVLDANGVGQTSSVLRAINWAITNRERYNIRVLNMSLGAPVRESYRLDPVCRAVAEAVRAGIVVVTSAGNAGRAESVNGQGPTVLVYGSIKSPGNSPDVITVGATDSHDTARRSDDTVTDWSSKGPTQYDHSAKPDIIAPGRRIIAAVDPNSTLAAQYPEKVVTTTAPNAMQNAYFTHSGTSFSAPVVSGIVALMLDANKSLTPTLVKAALLRTAQSLPSLENASAVERLLKQGAGLVNAIGAVKMAQAIVNKADRLEVGDRIFKSNGTLNDIDGRVTIGGESFHLGNRVVYVTGVAFTRRPVLVNGIVMGDGVLIKDGIVMGDGILVSDGIVMGDSILNGNGLLLSDGVLIKDGIVMGDSILIIEGIVMGDGILVGDGIVMGDGVLIKDGIVMGDGVPSDD